MIKIGLGLGSRYLSSARSGSVSPTPYPPPPAPTPTPTPTPVPGVNAYTGTDACVGGLAITIYSLAPSSRDPNGLYYTNPGLTNLYSGPFYDEVNYPLTINSYASGNYMGNTYCPAPPPPPPTPTPTPPPPPPPTPTPTPTPTP